MLIMDESSTDRGEEETDDEDEQYGEDQGTSADDQGKMENDDESTATNSEDEEEEEGQSELDAEDYEGIVFTQKDVLCNVTRQGQYPIKLDTIGQSVHCRRVL